MASEIPVVLTPFDGQSTAIGRPGIEFAQSARTAESLTRTLGVLFMKVAEGGPDYTVDHSAGVFYIDPAGRLVSVLTPPHTADSVIARFKAVSAFIEGKS